MNIKKLKSGIKNKRNTILNRFAKEPFDCDLSYDNGFLNELNFILDLLKDGNNENEWII